jgi:hypothetical protein
VLSDLGVNTSAISRSTTRNSSSYNHEGYVIGDAILFTSPKTDSISSDVHRQPIGCSSTWKLRGARQQPNATSALRESGPPQSFSISGSGALCSKGDGEVTQEPASGIASSDGHSESPGRRSRSSPWIVGQPDGNCLVHGNSATK